jgi:hypothetical protein
MKAFFPLLPFVAALSLLACQSDDGPVADDAAAPPENLVGDAAADGLAAPANAAAAEAVDRAAVPVAADGMGWTVDAAGSALVYGPAGASPMLKFACAGAGSGRHLVVTRFHPAVPGKTATMSFTGGGHASSLPMHALARPGGPGESAWHGEARGDMARAVARTFAADGLINVTLGGTPSLAVPNAPRAIDFFNRCVAG